MHNALAVNFKSMEGHIKHLKDVLFGMDDLENHSKLYDDDDFYRTPATEHSQLGGKELKYLWSDLGRDLEKIARSISDTGRMYNASVEVHLGYESLVEKQNEKNSAPTTKRRAAKKAANKKTS